jgi:outer membrane protein
MDSSSYTVAGVLSWSAFDGGVSNAGDRPGFERSVWSLSPNCARPRTVSAIRLPMPDARPWKPKKRSARSAGLEQATEAQRLVKRRYENGMATLIELLAPRRNSTSRMPIWLPPDMNLPSTAPN